VPTIIPAGDEPFGRSPIVVVVVSGRSTSGVLVVVKVVVDTVVRGVRVGVLVNVSEEVLASVSVISIGVVGVSM
jgi:hypothetical protein